MLWRDISGEDVRDNGSKTIMISESWLRLWMVLKVMVRVDKSWEHLQSIGLVTLKRQVYA